MRAVRLRARVAFVPLSLLGVLLCGSGADAGIDDVRRRPMAILFPHAPADLSNVADVVPLGNLNPEGKHVLAVDHVYMSFVHPQGGGVEEVPVYAMAAGHVVGISWQTKGDIPVRDWQLTIAHSGRLASYVDHVHALAEKLERYLDGVPEAAWIDVGGQFALVLPGHRSAPTAPHVAAGEEVARARNYRNNWAIGVIDSRVRPHFEGQGSRRYPTLEDLFQALGVVSEPPYSGQKTLNAACFISYLPPEQRALWTAKLASQPKVCGRTAWDVPDRLRGAWFNPAVDDPGAAPVTDLDWAALSIIPDNLAPTTRVQIGIPHGHPLCALDPQGVYPQLGTSVPFRALVNGASGARVNPNPAQVGPDTGTVCYDLVAHPETTPEYLAIYFHLLDSRTVAVKLDPTPHAAAVCSPGALPEPDGSWINYVR